MAGESIGTPEAPAQRVDRIPLYSEEAEKGVLGSILLDAANVMDFCLIRLPDPDCFHVRSHRLVYEALQKMDAEKKVVDILTLAECLKSLGHLDDVGGVDFLNQLMDSTPTSAHADYYIEIVRQKHVLRRIVRKAREAENLCYTSDEDADIVLGRAEQSFFEIGQQQSDDIEPWEAAVKKSVGLIEQMMDSRAGISGIPSGYRDLDSIMMGMHRGDMIVLAARPSMGKTSLAMNIVENVAMGEDRETKAVGVFSLEMSREQLVLRMLCSTAGVDTQRIHRGTISVAEHGQLMQAADRLRKARIYVDDSAALEIVDLRARARRMKKRFNIDLFVIDYLQLMNNSKVSRNDGRQQVVSSISGGLKAMAKELNVPVLVLSQLNRSPDAREKGEPRLSDLRESGSIEQDADVVLLLYRPGKYGENADQATTIVEIAKQRNGPVGQINLIFRSQLTRFENAATKFEGEPPPEYNQEDDS
ncbi:MAG: replicative DNA helicase [Lentisphaerae bacterium]|nr:replicative DNA helicase [Lentisphaerota bacterium]